MSNFSTAAKLTENSAQEIVAKQQFPGIDCVKRLSIAVSMAATLVSLVSATPADAAIMTGNTITGTWGDDGGDFTPGDPFTATYSYDDILPFSISLDGYSYSGFFAPLLSLLLSSGSYSHLFTKGTFSFQNYKFAQVTASDNSEPQGNYFIAYRKLGQNNGTPFLTEFAKSTGTYGNARTYSNVNFTPDPTAPTTAIPTPALLPGMVAFGLGVWRKRKAVVAEQV